MSNYIKSKIYLSEGQISKFKSALKNDKDVTLQIDLTKSPNYDIYLTKTQIDKITKGKRITLSKTQLKKNGGFLPFLIPILASLATGALSGTAAWGAKKALDKISGSGFKKNSGKGVFLNSERPT